MRLNCGLSWEERQEAKKDWHRIFALWPRRVGQRQCIWLGYVERKGDYVGYEEYGGWFWKYRTPEHRSAQ